ncbi:MAG: radical SAM protein, partial [Planctomycetota bacterium]
YQPIEREKRLTRGCLEVARDCGQPVTIVTKNALVTRDLDILAEMAAKNLARVGVSITTLDAGLARSLEPRTSTPTARLRAIRELADAGVPVRVMHAPVIPGLNDEEMPAVLAAAKEAGASAANYVMLRLPWSVRPVFLDWLERCAPTRRDRVLNRIGSVRGGKLNDPRFGDRHRGEGVHADAIADTFKLFTRKLGLDVKRPPLSRGHFRRPGRPGQKRLFD